MSSLLKFILNLPNPNLRRKEARQPRFPMEICDHTFQLVEDHLNALDYDGPVGLSCDDTKLFATYRLYWDKDKDSYVLIGGTDGPLIVTDPDNVQEVIDQAKTQKASKVSSRLQFSMSLMYFLVLNRSGSGA